MALQLDEMRAAKEALFEAHAALGDAGGKDPLNRVRSALGMAQKTRDEAAEAGAD